VTGDIGTHAENLGRYITGLQIESLCADFTSFVPGAELEDDSNLLLRYEGGAKGILFSSQISHGEENNLNIRVYGTKGSLQWFQEHPNELIRKETGKPVQIYRRGNEGYLSKAANGATRIPFGHPEAFIEAFANVYQGAAEAIGDAVAGRKPKASYDFPDVEDGVIGVAFIEAAVKSAKASRKWVDFPQM
jgi:predicted dehydrogenase